MPHAELKKLYARLGELRATRDSATGGRKEVYAAEVKDIEKRIMALKNSPGYSQRH